jgi:hypothetical protein
MWVVSRNEKKEHRLPIQQLTAQESDAVAKARFS